MTTIKSIKHLRAEKKRLAQRQQELEQKIRNTWTELKQSIKPSTIAAEAFGDAAKNSTQKNTDHNSILKNLVSFGVSILAKKLADKTGEKLGKMFSRN